MALSANAVGCHGVDSSADSGRLDLRLGVEEDGWSEMKAEERSLSDVTAGIDADIPVKCAPPLLTQCFPNPG